MIWLLLTNAALLLVLGRRARQRPDHRPRLLLLLEQREQLALPAPKHRPGGEQLVEAVVRGDATLADGGACTRCGEGWTPNHYHDHMDYSLVLQAGRLERVPRHPFTRMHEQIRRAGVSAEQLAELRRRSR